LVNEWEKMVNDDLVYQLKYNPFTKKKKETSKKPLMITYEEKSEKKDSIAWPVLNSLRTVDIPCECILKD
jgi:hypothetical protein